MLQKKHYILGLNKRKKENELVILVVPVKRMRRMRTFPLFVNLLVTVLDQPFMKRRIFDISGSRIKEFDREKAWLLQVNRCLMQVLGKVKWMIMVGLHEQSMVAVLVNMGTH